MVKKWIGVSIMFLALAGCSRTSETPSNIPLGDYGFTSSYIAPLIKSEMKKHDITGLSIALVDNQRVLWAKGFGYADKANKVPATPETIYRAGSISKLFTATAVMQLAEQGKMDIDKPLQTYLPKFFIKSRFPNAAPITPRNIMTHHSGLPANFLKGMWTSKPEPFEDLVEQVDDEYVAYPPNYLFSYSNLGYTLLGCALERVAGQPFASYMKLSLLSPLGMTHSSFSQYPENSPLGSKAYRKGKEVEAPPLRDVPAGGLNTTVLDLSRFVEMVFAHGRAGNRQIIKPQTLAEMLRPQNADVPLDLDFRIGLGWALDFTNIRNAGPVAGHSGGTLYHCSLLIILPEDKLGVVVMANSADAWPVIDKAAVATLKLALEAKTGIRQPIRKKKMPAAISASVKKLRPFGGLYDTPYGVLDVRVKSGYLQVKVMGKTAHLILRADGRVYAQYRLLGLIPRNGSIGYSRATIEGHDIVEGYVDGREFLAGELIMPVPIPKRWLQRIGKYEIANRGNDVLLFHKFQLRQDRGLLLLSFLPRYSNEAMTFALKPVSNSEAVIRGLGSNRGETICVVKRNGEEFLQYSGYLLENK